MVEIVTDIVMSATGVITARGTHGLGETDGHELESETAWHFGFYSRPKDGARGVVLKADGQGNTSFLVCYRDKQYELSLEKGEVGMKSAFDSYVLLDQDGHVHAVPKTGSLVKLSSGDQFVALSNLVDSRLAAMRTYINGHVHNDPVSGATTAPTVALAAQASVAAQDVKAT